MPIIKVTSSTVLLRASPSPITSIIFIMSLQCFRLCARLLDPIVIWKDVVSAIMKFTV